jgi:hypothetical protein
VTLAPLVLLAASVLATVVALVDVLQDGNGDLVILLTIVLVLLLTAAAAALRARSAVPLRPDLTTWLRRQAGATGEPVGRLADRCVAAYRAGLTGETPSGSAAVRVPVAREASR